MDDASEDDVAKEFGALGRRVGLLLVAADLPEEVKEGLVEMVGEMTPEEIDRLTKALEANVKGAVESEADAVRTRVEARPDLIERRAAAARAASATLDEVEAELARLEKEAGAV